MHLSQRRYVNVLNHAITYSYAFLQAQLIIDKGHRPRLQSITGADNCGVVDDTIAFTPYSPGPSQIELKRKP